MGAQRFHLSSGHSVTRLRSPRVMSAPTPAAHTATAGATSPRGTNPMEILENPGLSMGEKLLLIEALFAHDSAG